MAVSAGGVAVKKKAVPASAGVKEPAKEPAAAVLLPADVPPLHHGMRTLSASVLDVALAKVVAHVKKDLGAGHLLRLDGPGAYPEIKYVVATGLPTLDAVFGGCGGLPLGKLIEIFGAESSGKTSTCKMLAARCQQVNILPVTIDTEQSGVLDYDVALGLNPSRAGGAQPSTMEEVFELVISTVEGMEAAGVLGIVFWDSVAATPLQSELDATMDENQVPGARARFLSKHLPQVVAKLRSGRVGLVFVNQLREKIGVTWGKTTFSPGGRALRHYAHVRLELTGFGQIKGPGDRAVGIRTRVKAVKNKIGMPYRECELEIRFDPPGPRIIAAGTEKKPVRTPYTRRDTV